MTNLNYEDMNEIHYSEKEQKLFIALGYEDLLTQQPIVLYRMVALNLFKHDKTGSLVCTVRRCLNAIDNGSPHRLTKEFDDLIQND